MKAHHVAQRLSAKAAEAGFEQNSEEFVGQLLRILVAMKPNGRYLELGTGMGAGLVWLLSGLGRDGRVVTIELEAEHQAIAHQELGADDRLTWVLDEGAAWLRTEVTDQAGTFDGVFADTWPGKYHDRDLAMRLVKPGGWYLVDDLYPQPGWPDGHQANVDILIADLAEMESWTTEFLGAGSGVMLCIKQEI